MNYYERIQKSIDYIESNLENEIDITAAAQEAYMSLSSFYRMFFALVGYSVKEYVRLRRISLAAAELSSGNASVIDLAVKYGFNSGDSFSRAFKRISGFLPSEFRKSHKTYGFERMSIMDKYYDIQDAALLQKYPEIKVLKRVEPMRVAYYLHYGEHPETNAFSVMQDWLKRSGLNINTQKLRIFGYDNPSPATPEDSEYGYEVCVTISDNLVVNDPKVKTKILEGGLYAVTSVKSGNEIGKEIMASWKRFRNWLEDSRYTYGGHQWMEEHLGFDEAANHIGSVDLYMPITEKRSMD